MLSKKLQSYKFGFFAEYISIFFLFLKGYIPIAHRYKSQFGEIDLILYSMFSKTIIFVEVKARKDKKLLEVLSMAQKARISKSASFFIATNPKYSDYTMRFDLIIFNTPLSLKYIKNAWFVDEF